MPSPSVVDRPTPPTPTGRVPSPPVVAVAGWLIPGAGYWLIGQRARGLTAGITIVTLFVAGLLIGGVRALQVPGYGEDGEPLYRWTLRGGTAVSGPSAYPNESARGPRVVFELRGLLGEVGNKPWSICQVMNGPIAVVAGAWSVQAARPGEDGSPPSGVLSHSRINEIGVLYTAVAGMLNLLVILDASSRAGRGVSSTGTTPTPVAAVPQGVA